MLRETFENSERSIDVARGQAELFQDEARDSGSAARQKDKEIDELEDKIRELENLAAGQKKLTDNEQHDLGEREGEIAKLKAEAEKLVKTESEKYRAAEKINQEIVAARENSLPRIDPGLAGAYSDLASFNQESALSSTKEIKIKQDGERDAEKELSPTEKAQNLYGAARIVQEYQLSSLRGGIADPDKLLVFALELADKGVFNAAQRLMGGAQEIRRTLAADELSGKAPAGRLSLALATTLTYSMYLELERDKNSMGAPYHDELVKVLNAVARNPAAGLTLMNDATGDDVEPEVAALLLLQREKYIEAERILVPAVAIDLLRKSESAKISTAKLAAFALGQSDFRKRSNP